MRTWAQWQWVFGGRSLKSTRNMANSTTTGSSSEPARYVGVPPLNRRHRFLCLICWMRVFLFPARSPGFTVLLGRRRRSSLWSQGFSYLQMCQYWVHSPFEWCNEAVVMSSECVGVTVGYSVAWDIKKIQLCPGGWGQGVCSNSLISRMLATVQHFEFNFQFHVLYLFS